MKINNKIGKIVISGLLITFLTGCGEAFTNESPEIEIETADTTSQFEGIVVNPDEAFNMSPKDKVTVYGDEDFMVVMDTIEYYSDTQTHIAYLDITTEGSVERVLLVEKTEEEKAWSDNADDYYIDSPYLNHTITVYDIKDDYAKISFSDKIVVPEATQLSGNPEDVISFDEYEYLETDMAFIFLDKDIKYPGNLAEVIDDAMYALEKVTGFEFYPDEPYCTDGSIGIADLYLGEDPWYGVNRNDEKINIFIFKDNGTGRISNSPMGNAIFIKEDFLDDDGKITKYSTLTHELTHVLFGINIGESQCKIIDEGLAEFYQTKAVIEMAEKYNVEENEKHYTYGILEGLNEENAEELFIEDYQDDSGRVGEYRYGFYLMTYLTETYGEDTLKEFFGVLNGKHLCDELFYSDMICDNLKEMYGENIFTEFGKWYVANKEKYYWDER